MQIQLLYFYELLFLHQRKLHLDFIQNKTMHSLFPKYRDIDGLLAISYSEAARTGELYPGRPVIRPRVRFANGSGGDGWSEDCAKDYHHAASISPGLFTLQCACSHPKIIRVSVMMSSESVTTALNAILSQFKVLP